MTDCTPECPRDCTAEWIFDRVRVYHVVRGETLVEWTLHPLFRGTGPLVFQLQAGRTANPQADDWVAVGLPVTDAFFAIDDTQRLYGKRLWTHYRLKLTTGDGDTFYSPPQSVEGDLKHYDWRRARAMTHSWSLYLRKTPSGAKGHLLKRRLFGEACSCVDFQTGEVENPQHPVCYGTGFVGGYFAPMPCVYADFSPKAVDNHLDDKRATVQDGPVCQVKMLAVPQLFSNDVWVNDRTDERWEIEKLTSIAEVRGVPIVVEATLHFIPMTDIVYSFPVS